MTDYIGDALAAEEHRQGLAHGDDPDHCGECKIEALRRRQAACDHEGDQIDVSTCGTRELLCQDCGTIREVAR